MFPVEAASQQQETAARAFQAAQNALAAVAGRHLPELEESAEPSWSAHPGEASRRIFDELKAAGFVGPQRVSFVGRDVTFTSPEEYFEAQVMISSDLRTRASLATPAVRNALRDDFVGQARRVLDRGGELLYPFGAVVIGTDKPA